MAGPLMCAEPDPRRDYPFGLSVFRLFEGSKLLRMITGRPRRTLVAASHVALLGFGARRPGVAVGAAGGASAAARATPRPPRAPVSTCRWEPGRQERAERQPERPSEQLRKSGHQGEQVAPAEARDAVGQAGP